MQVSNRQYSPLRIMADAKSGETSTFIHHPTVTPVASNAVPAITGKRGNSL
jgi:hypothetical protein